MRKTRTGLKEKRPSQSRPVAFTMAFQSALCKNIFKLCFAIVTVQIQILDISYRRSVNLNFGNQEKAENEHALLSYYRFTFIFEEETYKLANLL